jgi:hypothetical protein
MRCVYVLMYKKNGPMDVSVDKPYAVFEDSITAEKMKRDGDEIVKVPYFSDEMPNVLRINEDDLKNTPWTVTWRNTDSWGREGSTAKPPDYNVYPKVTCSNKTVDEHSWTNRSD